MLNTSSATVYQYNDRSSEDDLRLRLLPLICELNALPIRQFHPTWLESTDEWPDIATLAQHPTALPDLSAFMMKRYRLKSVWVHDFTELRYRLLLMNSVSLNRVVYYLGLIVVSPYLRKLIDGGAIRDMRQAIGQDEFEFTRKKAAFYNPAYLGKLIKVDRHALTPQTIRDEIIKRGVMCMGLLYWDEDKSIKTRLAIKLPKANARLIVSKAFDKAPKDRLNSFRDTLFKVIIKLIKEVEPSWQTIFA